MKRIIITVIWQRYVHAVYSFERECWKGETVKERLEWVFRQFNRVNGTELISTMKLRVPSLSVGDYVLHGIDLYKCESAGFVRIDSVEGANQMMAESIEG